MPYLTAATIESRLASLATTYPSLCTRLTFPNQTHDRRQVSYITSAMISGGSRPTVLITGGVHAREWAPPDAVLSFAEKLFQAYSTQSAITYPVFTDTADKIDYQAFSIPWGDVKQIVERLDLYIAPLVNPDGRFFSQFDPANMDWRKNRRPAPSPDDVGVDINRNFDIAWDFDKYYTATAANTVSVSKSDMSSEVYQGPNVASEPETQNVQWLVTNQNIRFFLDIHSAGRTILYPWGLEDNQSSDPNQNFTNAIWNTKRDGRGGMYGEYFPDNLVNSRGLLLTQHILLANRMKDAILKTASANKTFTSRSTYIVKQSIDLYPTIGAADDYTFSRQFLTNPANTVFAYTLECGSNLNGEGGFHPNYITKYPKIEREVHAAIWGFLSHIAGVRAPSISSSSGGAGGSGGGSSSVCFITTAASDSLLAPHVAFLKTLRDQEVKATAFGSQCVQVFNRIYYSFSPQVARYLHKHQWARTLTRTLLTPFIIGLRGCVWITQPIQPLDLRVYCLSGLILGLSLVGLMTSIGVILQIPFLLAALL
jgi:Zinc carboxypeptidase